MEVAGAPADRPLTAATRRPTRSSSSTSPSRRSSTDYLMGNSAWQLMRVGELEAQRSCAPANAAACSRTKAHHRKTPCYETSRYRLNARRLPSGTESQPIPPDRLPPQSCFDLRTGRPVPAFQASQGSTCASIALVVTLPVPLPGRIGPDPRVLRSAEPLQQPDVLPHSAKTASTLPSPRELAGAGGMPRLRTRLRASWRPCTNSPLRLASPFIVSPPASQA